MAAEIAAIESSPRPGLKNLTNLPVLRSHPALARDAEASPDD